MDSNGETVDWRALNLANWNDRVPVSVMQYRLTSAGLLGLREWPVQLYGQQPHRVLA